MGSLMAGWDSKSERYKGNWTSLTKEEIDGYWKSKKKSEEEHFGVISSPSDHSSQESTTMEESGGKFRRSSSLPLPNTKEGSMDMDSEINWENIVKRSGWWTRSNWAFLNEPPVTEGHGNTYASQFHVAHRPPSD